MYYNVLCRARVREQLHFKITDTTAQFVTKFACNRGSARHKSNRGANCVAYASREFFHIVYIAWQHQFPRNKDNQFSPAPTDDETRGKKSSMDFFARDDAEIRRGNTNGFIIGGWRNLIYSNVTILSPTNPMVFWTVANTCVTAESQIIFRKSMFELCRDENVFNLVIEYLTVIRMIYFGRYSRKLLLYYLTRYLSMSLNV